MSRTTTLPLTAELLLLLHDDRTGKPLIDAQKRRAVTSGAAITELALDGMLVLDEGVPARKARLRATAGATPPSHLAEALERADGHRPKDAIARVGGVQDYRLRADAIRDAVMGDLAANRIVEAVEPRALRLIGPRWPLLQPDVERAVTTRLATVLDGADADPRTAALLTLSHAGHLLPKLFPHRDKKADARRVAEIAEDDWHGDAVTKAIAEINTVLMSAILVPIVVTGGS